MIGVLVTTWADSFGTWHASVPVSSPGEPDTTADRAREAIAAEIQQRDARADLSIMRVAKVRYTEHGAGTWVYRESWPSEDAPARLTHPVTGEEYDAPPRADVATCGECGRSWDDSLSTAVTPTPAARCPFEYDHEDETEN